MSPRVLDPPTWVAYPVNAFGRCDTCRAPAVFSLVRLDGSGSFAVSLLRLACQQHGPAVDERTA